MRFRAVALIVQAAYMTLLVSDAAHAQRVTHSVFNLEIVARHSYVVVSSHVLAHNASGVHSQTLLDQYRDVYGQGISLWSAIISSPDETRTHAVEEHLLVPTIMRRIGFDFEVERAATFGVDMQPIVDASLSLLNSVPASDLKLDPKLRVHAYVSAFLQGLMRIEHYRVGNVPWHLLPSHILVLKPQSLRRPADSFFCKMRCFVPMHPGIAETLSSATLERWPAEIDATNVPEDILNLMNMKPRNRTRAAKPRDRTASQIAF